MPKIHLCRTKSHNLTWKNIASFVSVRIKYLFLFFCFFFFFSNTAFFIADFYYCYFTLFFLFYLYDYFFFWCINNSFGEGWVGVFFSYKCCCHSYFSSSLSSSSSSLKWWWWWCHVHSIIPTNINISTLVMSHLHPYFVPLFPSIPMLFYYGCLAQFGTLAPWVCFSWLKPKKFCNNNNNGFKW